MLEEKVTMRRMKLYQNLKPMMQMFKFEDRAIYVAQADLASGECA